MIHKYLRLRKRASKDASGNSTTPRTGSLDLVNRNDRPFVRNAGNVEAGLLAESGTPTNSVARTLRIQTHGSNKVVHGATFSVGNYHFEANATDGVTPTNAGAVPVKAQGTITVTSNPADGENLLIGATTYLFKTSPAGAAHIKIGATAAITADHIVSAINGNSGQTGNVANPEAEAKGISATKITITAKHYGNTGNSCPFTTNANPEVTVDGSGFLGGTRASVDPQYIPLDIRTNAVKASLIGTFTGANGVGSNEVTVNGTAYSVVTAETTLTAGNFYGGGGSTESAVNLAAAINGTDGVNAADANVTAVAAGATVTVTAKVGGAAGNAIAVAESSGEFSWAGSATSLASGTDPTQNQARDLIVAAINSDVLPTAANPDQRIDFTCATGGTGNIDITWKKHGTDIDISAGGGARVVAAPSSLTEQSPPAVGAAGTEGIAGALRFLYDGTDAGSNDFIYICVDSDDSIKKYRWNKTAALTGL